jgi:hypothetical protein
VERICRDVPVERLYSMCKYKGNLEVDSMTIETATKYYIANKPVRHKVLGQIFIVDLYPSRLGSVRIKLANGTEMDCQLEFLDAV